MDQTHKPKSRSMSLTIFLITHNTPTPIKHDNYTGILFPFLPLLFSLSFSFFLLPLTKNTNRHIFSQIYPFQIPFSNY